MTRFRWLIAAVCVFAFGSAHAVVDPQTVWAYKYVLATATDFRDLGPVSRHMDDDKSLQTVEFLDLASELLATRIPQDVEEGKARVHLLRMLVSTENPRYFTVML